MLFTVLPVTSMTKRATTTRNSGSQLERISPLRDPQSLHELVERLHEGIYITNREGQIVDANPAFLQMLGFKSLAELQGCSASELLVDPRERAREIALLDKNGSVRDFELQIRRPDGEIRTFIDSAFAMRERPSGDVLYQGILVDITERKQLERQLQELSVRDPLTGCFNRRYLKEFEDACEHHNLGWGCIMLDVDYFKDYNDRFGHNVGDEVLVRISRFLMRQTRAQEGVVRLGGDEFAVLLAGSDAASTEHAASRLKLAGSRELPVEFSLGWAAREGGERLERTLARADQNLLAVRSQERSQEAERRRL